MNPGRAPRRAQLKARPPEGLRASWVSEGVVAVFSVPLRPDASPALPELTVAQRAVVELVLHGLPGHEVARRRGVKRATVYKQLEDAYRRLGVRSKSELAALIAVRRGR